MLDFKLCVLSSCVPVLLRCWEISNTAFYPQTWHFSLATELVSKNCMIKTSLIGHSKIIGKIRKFHICFCKISLMFHFIWLCECIDIHIFLISLSAFNTSSMKVQKNISSVMF